MTSRNDLDPICRENLMKLAEISEKTRSSVTFTFTSHFELFDNPLIIAATSRSDFDIRHLRRKKIQKWRIFWGIWNQIITLIMYYAEFARFNDWRDAQGFARP